MKFKIFSLLMFGSLQAYAGGGSSVGPANPASKNCIQLGGVLEPITTPAGQDNNCVIDEWQLFGKMEQLGLVQTHSYGPGSMPNPASVNCADISGTERIEQNPAGEEGFCVVEEWKLFDVINVTDGE